MTLREVYKSLGLDIEKTGVRIYQYNQDTDDEIVIFDSDMVDADNAPTEYLNGKVLWFTWHVTVNRLEVHLEA